MYVCTQLLRCVHIRTCIFLLIQLFQCNQHIQTLQTFYIQQCAVLYGDVFSAVEISLLCSSQSVTCISILNIYVYAEKDITNLKGSAMTTKVTITMSHKIQEYLVTSCNLAVYNIHGNSALLVCINVYTNLSENT